MLRTLRARWLARRRDLAMKQLEADRNTPDPTAIGHTDATSTMLYLGNESLSRILNPKAKTKTEWKGD
ncbi:MAG: hypothetical protein JWO12_152 [Frankiales bacterium]|jgi:hypothetical protein|nr:hypothetical protein [Frankiales bacterium]